MTNDTVSARFPFMETIHFPNLWVYARPAPDVPGQWEIHCLDMDVVSMGNSLQHALAMLVEGLFMVIIDDRKNGRDPLARRAPEEEWKPMWDVFYSAKAKPVTSEADLDISGAEVALQMEMILEPRSAAARGSEAPPSVPSSAPVQPRRREVFATTRPLGDHVCAP